MTASEFIEGLKNLMIPALHVEKDRERLRKGLFTKIPLYCCDFDKMAAAARKKGYDPGKPPLEAMLEVFDPETMSKRVSAANIDPKSVFDHGLHVKTAQDLFNTINEQIESREVTWYFKALDLYAYRILENPDSWDLPHARFWFTWQRVCERWPQKTFDELEEITSKEASRIDIYTVDADKGFYRKGPFRGELSLSESLFALPDIQAYEKKHTSGLFHGNAHHPLDMVRCQDYARQWREQNPSLTKTYAIESLRKLECGKDHPVRRIQNWLKEVWIGKPGRPPKGSTTKSRPRG